MTETTTAHTTVLLHEAVDALVIDPDGFYVDGTFGRGGHTAELLSKLSAQGSVVAIDKDPQAIAEGQVRFSEDARLQLVHGTFADLSELWRRWVRPASYPVCCSTWVFHLRR